MKRKPIGKNTVRYQQIYPYTKLPVLANKYKSDMPKRARLFCPPFREGKETGFYLFPPVDFSFYLADDYMKMRFLKPEGSYFEVSVDRNSAIGADDLDRKVRLEQVSEQLYEDTSDYYFERLSAETRPFLEFYNYLFYLGREEEPFDFWILIYIGGLIETDPGNRIVVKHPSNVLTDHPFIVYDGIVESSKWPGTLNIGIKPLRKNEWIFVSRETPLCQVVGQNFEIKSLEVVESKKVDDDTFDWTLEWYFLNSKNYKKKPGQYQRDLGIEPKWKNWFK
ncbi:MAG: hypothetical protein AAF429_04895 [Pseudomonadota bacterium]